MPDICGITGYFILFLIGIYLLKERRDS